MFKKLEWYEWGMIIFLIALALIAGLAGLTGGIPFKTDSSSTDEFGRLMAPILEKYQDECGFYGFRYEVQHETYYLNSARNREDKMVNIGEIFRIEKGILTQFEMPSAIFQPFRAENMNGMTCPTPLEPPK